MLASRKLVGMFTTLPIFAVACQHYEPSTVPISDAIRKLDHRPISVQLVLTDKYRGFTSNEHGPAGERQTFTIGPSLAALTEAYFTAAFDDVEVSSVTPIDSGDSNIVVVPRVIRFDSESDGLAESLMTAAILQNGSLNGTRTFSIELEASLQRTDLVPLPGTFRGHSTITIPQTGSWEWVVNDSLTRMCEEALAGLVASITAALKAPLVESAHPATSFSGRIPSSPPGEKFQMAPLQRGQAHIYVYRTSGNAMVRDYGEIISLNGDDVGIIRAPRPFLKAWARPGCQYLLLSVAPGVHRIGSRGKIPWFVGQGMMAEEPRANIFTAKADHAYFVRVHRELAGVSVVPQTVASSPALPVSFRVEWDKHLGRSEGTEVPREIAGCERISQHE